MIDKVLIFLILIFFMQDKTPPAAPKNLQVFTGAFEFSTPATLVWQQYLFIMGDPLKSYFLYFGRDSTNYDSLNVGRDTEIDLAVMSQDTTWFAIGAFYDSGFNLKTEWIRYPL